MKSRGADWNQLPELSVTAMDLGKDFATHGSMDKLYEMYGLNSNAMTKTALEVLENEN